MSNEGYDQINVTPPTAAEIMQSLYGGSGRKSKYGVDQSAKGKEARTYQGIVYHSKHELEVYRSWVEPQVNIGLLSNLQRQVRFDLHVTTPGGFKVKIGAYIADWTAQDRSGTLLILEAKGNATALYKRSKRHVEAEYGIRIMEL